MRIVRTTHSEYGGVSMQEELHFPSFGYYLDESDPEVVILRRQDDAFVAAFSPRGATKEGIIEAAKEHYRELLIHNFWVLGGKATEEDRSG
jgi:hypothetical protein